MKSIVQLLKKRKLKFRPCFLIHPGLILLLPLCTGFLLNDNNKAGEEKRGLVIFTLLLTVARRGGGQQQSCVLHSSATRVYVIVGRTPVRLVCVYTRLLPAHAGVDGYLNIYRISPYPLSGAGL